MMPAGSINAWECPACGKLTVARHVDRGVTPMFLGCRTTPGCMGRAVSLGYPNQDSVPQHIVDQVAWEWYRPPRRERRAMSREMQHHLDGGGLALREVTS